MDQDRERCITETLAFYAESETSIAAMVEYLRVFEEMLDSPDERENALKFFAPLKSSMESMRRQLLIQCRAMERVCEKIGASPDSSSPDQ